MAEYSGSVELISGITQKNGLDFPLVDAPDIQVYEDGTRLDTALEDIVKVQDSEPSGAATKIWLKGNSVTETQVPTYAEFTEVSDAVDGLSDDIGDLTTGVGELTTSLGELTTTVGGKVSKPATNPNGTNGQLLRTNGDGTTTWVDQGLPTDAQTATAVSSWLTAHPEATTTVTDGSITQAKLENTLSGKIDQIAEHSEEIATQPKIVDEEETDSDLDITDPQGNVLLRMADGHVATKNFDSSSLTASFAAKVNIAQGAANAGKVMTVGLDGNLTPADPSAEIEVDDTLTQEGEAADAKATGDAIAPLAKVVDTTESAIDLDVVDPSGNVLMRLDDGDIQTKNFNSAEVTQSVTAHDASIKNLVSQQFDNGGVAVAENMDVAGGSDFTTLLTVNLKPGVEYTLSLGISQALASGTVYAYLLDANGDYIGANGSLFGITAGNTSNSTTVTLTSRYENARYAVKCVASSFTVATASISYDVSTASEYTIPDYYFTDGYLDAKIDRINELAEAAGSDGDVFIFITDVHPTQNAKHSPALINYIASRTNIPRLFDGGDAINGGSYEWPRIYRKAFGKDCHFAMGNHEYFNQRTGAALYYMFDIVNNNQIGNPDRHYYYVDDVQVKTRYIVMAAFDEMETPTSEAGEGFETDQITWLTDTALNVESGWTIIILTHAVYYGEFTNYTWYLLTFAEPFVNAIDNYSGNGTIAFVMQGHLHADGVNVTPGGIPVIATTCDKYRHWISSGTDKEPWLDKRVEGTVTEQAFDVVIHNKSTRTINIVRVGGFATFDGVGIDELNAAGEREITY